MSTSASEHPSDQPAAVGSPTAGAHGIPTELDSRIQQEVLVFGSLPPHGRDLDLLARRAEQSVIVEALRQRGFVELGNQWASFRDGRALLVELVPAAAWRLPPEELSALFAEGEPIDGLQRLLRPSPHHQLLIVARRHARTRGGLPQRLRERVDEALSRNPDAWALAAKHAPAWGSPAGLKLLAESYQGSGNGSFRTRARSAAELAKAIAERPELGWTAARRTLFAHRAAAIVAFSGLDGAGKSSQARALHDNLKSAGIDSEVVWPPAKNVLFQMNPRLKGALRGVLERIGRPAEPTAADPEERGPAGTETDERELEFPPLPSQRRVVIHGLAAIVSLSQVLALRRARPKRATSPPVLIYDRYALDALVYIRDRWGEGQPLRWQSWLVTRLTPTPAIAYLLELDPQTAFHRKQDFPLQNLRDRAVLYHELHDRLGVHSLDATRPAQALSEEIATQAWVAVARRGS